MERERFKLTDEELRRKWIEWGCEEEIVDQIVARVNDETPPGLVPEPFVFRHWRTYSDKELCLEIFESYKSGEYGKVPEHEELTEEELAELKKEIDSYPDGGPTLELGWGRCIDEEFAKRMLNKVLKEFEEEKKAKGEW